MNKTLFNVAFYNLENFFDTKDDPKTDDNPFTPKGIMHWIMKRYLNKAKKIGYVISQIGLEETGKPPLFVGLGEVENKRVLNDLLQSKYLKNIPYGFVHYESNDRRGMDVALLYHKDYCQVLESQAYPLELFTNKGIPYMTRDILYVKLLLNKQITHVLINHWPSRREGDFKSNHKRVQAGQRLREIVNYIQYEEDDSHIIIMGDFNTDPTDEIMQTEVVHPDFFNPAQQLFAQKKGSLNHFRKWHFFDQIILSQNYNPAVSKTNLTFQKINVFSPKYLQYWHGKQKGYPFRTYKGQSYQAGYSDHFPVYVVLKS